MRDWFVLDAFPLRVNTGAFPDNINPPEARASIFPEPNVLNQTTWIELCDKNVFRPALAGVQAVLLLEAGVFVSLGLRRVKMSCLCL